MSKGIIITNIIVSREQTTNQLPGVVTVRFDKNNTMQLNCLLNHVSYIYKIHVVGKIKDMPTRSDDVN